MATILVDMDGILADCCADWCDWLSQDYRITVTTADITDWDMAQVPKLKGIPADDIYSYLFKPGFFRYLKPLPGALEGMQELFRAGHELFIVTSPSGPQSMVEKCAWVAQHLPFIDQKRIKFSHHKTMIAGDILIDDRGSTLEQYVERWPNATAMGIEYPYNSYLSGRTTVELYPSFTDTKAAWEAMVARIQADRQQ